MLITLSTFELKVLSLVLFERFFLSNCSTLASRRQYKPEAAWNSVKDDHDHLIEVKITVIVIKGRKTVTTDCFITG